MAGMTFRLNNGREDVKKYFENPAAYLHKRFGILVRSELINRMIGSFSNKHILDAGCGDGTISLDYLRENKVTFLDSSPQMLKLVENQIPIENRPNAKLINEAIENCNLETRYDVIFAIGVLAHVTSIPETIKWLNRHLNDDGCLVLQFSDFSNLTTRINWYFTKYRRYKLNRLTSTFLRGSLEQIGLTVEREIRYSILIPGMGRMKETILYRWTMLTATNRILSRLGSDVIWILKKKRG